MTYDTVLGFVIIGLTLIASSGIVGFVLGYDVGKNAERDR